MGFGKEKGCGGRWVVEGEVFGEGVGLGKQMDWGKI